MTSNTDFEDEIEEIVYSAQEIAQAIEGMALRIGQDYAGQPLVLLGVLKGALCLTADLTRALIRIPQRPSSITVDFTEVSSYGNARRSSGQIRLERDMEVNIAGQKVVIVEDIVEGGLTLQHLQTLCRMRQPKSLRPCVLLDKPHNRRVDLTVHYLGLTVPDAYIVGYGLDYQEKYRHLPYLAKLRSQVFSPVRSSKAIG